MMMLQRLVSVGFKLQVRVGVRRFYRSSVTPLATINDQGQVVRMILDKALFDYEHIYVHPLQNSATVVLTPADLIRFFNVTNHTYMVYDFINNRVV